MAEIRIIQCSGPDNAREKVVVWMSLFDEQGNEYHVAAQLTDNGKLNKGAVIELYDPQPGGGTIYHADLRLDHNQRSIAVNETRSP